MRKGEEGGARIRSWNASGENGFGARAARGVGEIKDAIARRNHRPMFSKIEKAAPRKRVKGKWKKRDDTRNKNLGPFIFGGPLCHANAPRRRQQPAPWYIFAWSGALFVWASPKINIYFLHYNRRERHKFKMSQTHSLYCVCVCSLERQVHGWMKNFVNYASCSLILACARAHSSLLYIRKKQPQPILTIFAKFFMSRWCRNFFTSLHVPPYALINATLVKISHFQMYISPLYERRCDNSQIKNAALTKQLYIFKNHYCVQLLCN